MNDHDPQAAAAAAAASPDLDLVPGDDWPQRDFPIDDGRRKDSVRVVIRQSVLNDIHQHGLSRTDVEICGVMVGNVYRDERGPFVYVEANIRGRHSDSQAAQVTFTSETWNHIHGEMDRDHPDLRILGWYHTHPGFGIFLSGMDLFIHENFFNGHEQMALVFDPISGDEGLFLWRGGKAMRDGFLIHRDAAEDPPREHTVPASDPPLTAGAGPTSDDLSARLARIERRQMLGCFSILFLMMLAVVAPLATWFVWPGPMFIMRDAKILPSLPPPSKVRVEPPADNRREQPRDEPSSRGASSPREAGDGVSPPAPDAPTESSDEKKAEIPEKPIEPDQPIEPEKPQKSEEPKAVEPPPKPEEKATPD